MPKQIAFFGSALADLRMFPEGARRDAGYQLNRVQDGLEPNDFKPISAVGPGAFEIRIWDESGTYRVIYVAKFKAAVCVLHAFKKTTQQITNSDIELAARRYLEAKGECDG